MMDYSIKLPESLPWDFRAIIREFLKADTKLLDINSRDINFLLRLNNSFANTSVSVNTAESFKLCSSKLSPLGIIVRNTNCEKIDFPDASFDVVIARNEKYNLEEVSRVLKKGGQFITEQIGAQELSCINKLFGFSESDNLPLFNLENECQSFINNGFKVITRNQSYPLIRFKSIKDAENYILRLPWKYQLITDEFKEKVLNIIKYEIENHESYIIMGHRFYISAKKLR